ncbi:MAG: hypothetical protein CFE21_02460 [Bacteroidetes bacterium B1(2017)]|nr:MAG: hypothetical protein CFE21_02460 [Bacteroidetes bacterium B1(2017)]
MKVVIIGGGIAGYSLAILLQKKGIDFALFEKENKKTDKGLAFLIHEDAVAILRELLGTDETDDFPGWLVNEINLKWHTNEDIKTDGMGNWSCMKRSMLVSKLKDQIPEDKIFFEHSFSHFKYEDGKAISVEFKNGNRVFGDVFVGADGAKSAVRKELFGEVDYTKVEVKELVGLVSMEQWVKEKPQTFTKYISSKESLTFGVIPANENLVVWFMQYPIEMQMGFSDSPDSLKEFCKEVLHDFPEPVHQIIELNKFENSFVWYGTDFETLKSFHKSNVVLIGDAAHMALPFTSAGTTNALIDAAIIADTLFPTSNVEQVFKAYYSLRAPMVSMHLEFGRTCKNNFLNRDFSSKAIPIPLIKESGTTIVSNVGKPKVKILYFTDPICSTCWMIQPQIRKLLLLYGSSIDLKYHMGGLLPSWETYTKGRIKKPDDAASYWKELAETNTMPIFSDVWENDPLQSSYPPSIAIKAAQFQDKAKASLFLRHLNELVFFESKNISDTKVIMDAAEFVGLNVSKLIQDMESEGENAFNLDLELAKEYKLKSLPTFVFSIAGKEPIILSSYQEFEAFESALLTLLPSAQKHCFSKEIEDLFLNYFSYTQYELAYLSSLSETDLQSQLNKLLASGFMKEIKHGGQILYRKTNVA